MNVDKVLSGECGINYKNYNISVDDYREEYDILEVVFMEIDYEKSVDDNLGICVEVVEMLDGFDNKYIDKSNGRELDRVWCDNGGDGLYRCVVLDYNVLRDVLNKLINNGGEFGEILEV